MVGRNNKVRTLKSLVARHLWCVYTRSRYPIIVDDSLFDISHSQNTVNWKPDWYMCWCDIVKKLLFNLLLVHERRRWFGLPPTKAEGQVTWITHRLDTTYLLPCRPRWARQPALGRPGFSPTHPPPARREEKRTKSAVAYQPTTTRSLKGFHTRGTSTIKRETNEREET